MLSKSGGLPVRVASVVTRAAEEVEADGDGIRTVTSTDFEYALRSEVIFREE